MMSSTISQIPTISQDDPFLCLMRMKPSDIKPLSKEEKKELAKRVMELHSQFKNKGPYTEQFRSSVLGKLSMLNGYCLR